MATSALTGMGVRKLLAGLALAALLGGVAFTQMPVEVTQWQLSFQNSSFGPLQLRVEATRTASGHLSLRSASGAQELLAALPGAQSPMVDLDDGSWAFGLDCDERGHCEGASTASRAGDPIRLQLADDGRITGTIDKGWFRGEFSAVQHEAAPGRPLRDYPGVVAQLREVLRTHLFDPQLLADPEVEAYLSRLEQVSGRAIDDADLLLAARWGWSGQPRFSHFELRRSHQDAGALARHFDGLEVGGDHVELRFEGDVAVLRVSTMMGRDTRRKIEQAMHEVIGRGAPALILDLRGNAGGDLAIIPLLGSLLAEPFSGVFVSAHASLPAGQAPGGEVLTRLDPWQGDSLLAFWRVVQSNPMTHVRFEPWSDSYSGQLLVLVDAKTASAAEIAAGALQESGRGKLVGEPTAGQVLSSAYFDLGEGFQAVVPVADYYARGTRRYEGRPLRPDFEATSAEALSHALSRLSIGHAMGGVRADASAAVGGSGAE